MLCFQTTILAELIQIYELYTKWRCTRYAQHTEHSQSVTSKEKLKYSLWIQKSSYDDFQLVNLEHNFPNLVCYFHQIISQIK
jgi:hypothetical protein